MHLIRSFIGPGGCQGQYLVEFGTQGHETPGIITMTMDHTGSSRLEKKSKKREERVGNQIFDFSKPFPVVGLWSSNVSCKSLWITFGSFFLFMVEILWPTLDQAWLSSLFPSTSSLQMFNPLRIPASEPPVISWTLRTGQQMEIFSTPLSSVV